MQSLAWGSRDGFHTMNKLLPGSCLSTAQCWWGRSTPIQGRDLSFCTQILTLFLCYVACDTELSLFMCVVSFPSRPSQSNNIFLHCDLRLYPHCELKQVWKPVLALKVERQLRHFTQHLTCTSLAPHLVPCAIIIILWEDFFPAKNAWNKWGFSQLLFFFFFLFFL